MDGLIRIFDVDIECPPAFFGYGVIDFKTVSPWTLRIKQDFFCKSNKINKKLV